MENFMTISLSKPKSLLSLRHVALSVQNFTECVHFYTETLGMSIEWQPDADNIYLTFGTDNLALHKMTGDNKWSLPQRLDHIGFAIKTPEAVDEWHAFLQAQHVKIKTAPKTHRDGARSFYCCDPDGNIVQMIYHPPICDSL
jgi:catechol 2,3-dioxygenase-like lactoylglutathione lyase family enzyme